MKAYERKFLEITHTKKVKAKVEPLQEENEPEFHPILGIVEVATEFGQAFLKEDEAPTLGDEMENLSQDDSEAFEKSLDDETDPTAFDVAQDVAAMPLQNVEKAKKWIQELDNFAEFINGMSEGSLNAQINAMDKEGSVFRGIVRSEQKRITKIAEETRALSEVLKSYVLGSDKKRREHIKTT